MLIFYLSYIGTLPAIIYFINSNGLDIAVNNILNSVDTVLIDFVSELVTGKVVSYQSANGEIYYTMQYAGEWQKTDMVTIILRLLVTFLAEGNNADAIVALIAMNSDSEAAANSAGTLINFVVSSMATEPGTSSAMSAIYYIFYSTKYSADELNKGYQEFNYTWRVILTFFETFGDPFTSASVTVLKTVLDEYFGGVVDSSGVASDGAMTFFERIAAFFQRIGDFFRRLFGLA